MFHSRVRAIKTRYKGYAFRSRLEARWAVFFDHLGIKWDYEPEGFELGNGMRYLPDFWLPDWRLWVEVKPSDMDAVTDEKATRMALQNHCPIFVTNGMPLSGGVIFAPRLAGGLLKYPAEVDWGARDGNYVWAFTDEKLGAPCFVWGDTEIIEARPEQKDDGSWYEMEGQQALMAARGARFEFGEKGAV